MTRAVSFQRASADRKLAPQRYEPYRHPASGRVFQRPTPSGPFVSATYVSIEATCPSTCRFKGHGCYVQSGIGGARARKLDDAADGLTGDEVAELEAQVLEAETVLDGRPTRLHVGGDVPSEYGARVLASAVQRLRARGAGPFWTYTHRWAEIPRTAWGPIHVLASVESLEEAAEAAALGYTPAFTMRYFASERAWKPRASRLRIVPCPAQTRGRTCVECRLCMRQLPKGTVIGFAMHGARSGKRRRALPVMWADAPRTATIEHPVDVGVLDDRMARAADDLRKTRATFAKTTMAIDEALEAMGLDQDEVSHG